jgi:ParB family chromosome partitioning protein
MSDKKIEKTKRLGMGLSALLGSMDDGGFLSSSDVKGYQMIDISKITTNPLQPRKVFLEEELLELATSIKQNGLLQPLLVRSIIGGNFEIVAGERRFRASKLAGLNEVPCIVKKITDEQVFLFAVIENIQRENLNPLEEAESYVKLMKDFSQTQDELSKIVGKSRSHIANLCRLVKLPNEVKKMILDGRLTNGHVRPLLTLNTEEQMIEIADIIVQNNYSVRKVEELINLIISDEEKLDENQNMQPSKKSSKAKEHHSDLVAKIIKDFTDKFQSPIKIKSFKDGGTISIKYKSEDELQKIMNTMIRK